MSKDEDPVGYFFCVTTSLQYQNLHVTCSTQILRRSRCALIFL